MKVPKSPYKVTPAVKSLQQKSNSLFSYELQEIVHAKAEVLDLQDDFS
ncbi:hypothetical protein RchiOBHm_Chr2g0151051 [Rosa chinensis]|uniref:Uncharacterized protein n=1 Tax=Rosa chinensis TaxID=74649 RepID=A0A2P6S013_ROSCH|nr:hypothetical protein RchiOBHm_Chr2g0151051 [Rosa chinensis]